MNLYFSWLLFNSLLHLGNVYLADLTNSVIRKVTVSTGIITKIAGTGTASYSGDNGQATSAGLYQPQGVAVDAAGSHSSLFCLFLVTFYYPNPF